LSFDRLLESTCCPPPGDALLAIASEFRSFDAGRTSFRLDDFARALFAVAAERDPGAAARALAALAVVAAEIGRRAGLKVGICSTAWGWYAGIGEPEPVADRPGRRSEPDPLGTDPLPLRPRGGVRGAHRRLRAARPRR
jgi:hypothetical protein